MANPTIRDHFDLLGTVLDSCIKHMEECLARRHPPTRSQAIALRKRLNALGVYFDWLEEYAVEDPPPPPLKFGDRG